MSELACPMIVILGMTASGKSQLAMEIAKKYNGELICADSRTVYLGMDIGTAKPGALDRKEVVHHLLDQIHPNETYTAASFKRDAISSIEDINSRGNLPIVVGGTGLYVDGLIYDYAFLPPASTEEREALEAMTVEDLQSKILERGYGLPNNNRNKRHLIRVIEANGAVPVKNGLRDNTLIIGIDKSKEEIVQRIEKRTNSMISLGLEYEVKKLSNLYGWESPGMSAVGYKEWKDYFNGTIGLEEVIDDINRNSLQYARRQRTWFKRSNDINWVNNATGASQMIKSFLQF